MATEDPNVARPGDHRRVDGQCGKPVLRRRVVFRSILLKSEINLTNLETGQVDFKLGIDEKPQFRGEAFGVPFGVFRPPVEC